MFHVETSTRIRRASSLTLSILIVSALTLTMTDRALAQDSNGVDRIEAISKRLEELEKQIEGLKRENAELKEKFGEKEKPAVTFAAAKEAPALAVERETPLTEARENNPTVRDNSAAQGEGKTQTKQSRIEFGGEIRLRPEVRDRNLSLSFIGVDSFIGQRVRLHAKVKLSNDLTGFLEIQDSRAWGTEFSTTSSIGGVDLHQAYIQVDHVLTPDLSLKMGRQELSYGNERLVGAFDWDFTGRSFDAIKAVYAKKRWSADVFAARLVDSFSFFAPGSGINQPTFALIHQDFYGVYLKFLNDNPTHKLETYGFLRRDNFSSRGEVGERRDSTGIYTVGARHEIRSRGGFHYDGEAAFQTGHRGPDDHRAFALAGSVGKYFESARKSHFSFEYDFATGDGDFRDGESREFIDLFPNNHIHYGYIDFMGWRNMHDFRLNIGFDPSSKLSFDADYHYFLLDKGGGRWTSASGSTLGFDPGGRSGRELGQELDLTLRFPYKEHMKFLAGYSLFIPGRFAKLTRTSDLSHFSYIQTRINF